MLVPDTFTTLLAIKLSVCSCFADLDLEVYSTYSILKSRMSRDLKELPLITCLDLV